MRILSSGWIFPALMLALAACGGGRLKIGRYYERGTVVEAKGADLAQAKRAALESVLDLFLSPEARELSAGRVEEKVLSRPDEFILRSESVRTDSGGTELKALVDYAGVRKALAPLIQEDLFGGGKKIRVSFSGSGDAELASTALREVLESRGFAVPEEGEGSEVVLRGKSSVHRLRDDRLGKFHPTRARLSVRADAETLSFEQEASALDLSAEGAKSKAIRNAAERVGARVSARWARGRRIVIMVAGLKDFSEARGLVKSLRGIEGVSGASLDSHGEYTTRLTVSSFRPEEDLARAVKGLEKLKLRIFAVTPGALKVEVDR